MAGTYVPYEIDDDECWREFRTVVKSVKSGAYCGEIWNKAERWLQGDMFDATMNYVFTKNVLSYFGTNYLYGYTREDLEGETGICPDVNVYISYHV